MRSLLITASLCVATVCAVKPMDLPCVTWIPGSYSEPTPNPSELFVAAFTYIINRNDNPRLCVGKGDVIPCFTELAGDYNWGHHDVSSKVPTDYCRNWVNGSVTYGTKFWLPKKGPKYETWKWHTVRSGDRVPANAIRHGESVMARSLTTAPGSCFGVGFTGWAQGKEDGTFGSVHFSIVKQAVTTDEFEVAVCEAYHPAPTPSPSPTPAPTSSPTLPPNNKPYIRFANTVPSSNKITATIEQGDISYTWTDYSFGDFSRWCEIFKANANGTILLESGGKTLLRTRIILTPGPLVVVVKGVWPPTAPASVETIAASYVPVASGSGARLFNLSPDTASATMLFNGKLLVQKIDFSVGSIWADIPEGTATFTVTDSATNKTLAEDTFAAPPAPFVFTNFLIGMANATSAAFKTKLVPLVDAPEH